MSAEYDLTQTLLAHLDPHLGLPLLSYLNTTGIYDTKDVAKAEYELAKRTAMTDYTLQFHKQAYPDEAEPKEVVKRREDLESKHASLQKDVEHVLTIIEDPNVASALKQDKALNLEWLQQNYKLTLEQIDALYRYGYFQYSCGNYSEASSYLYHYRILATDNNRTASSLWGKLACDVLTGEWDRALEGVRLLREHIDAQRATTSAVTGNAKQVAHEELLQKRIWLLHWSLFVWFNHPTGRVKLVELFLSPAYLATIQMSSWWLLRYLIVALVITRRQVSRGYVVEMANNPTGQSSNSNATNKLSPHAALREVSKAIQTESYRLKPDPFVDFFRRLYIDLDFDRAHEELAKAQEAIKQDFFLHEHADAFVDQARVLISEVYCRIHQDVDMADLSAHLNLSNEQGHKWILENICDGKSDATIDEKEGIVRMNQPRAVVYQSVIDKTRGITLRTAALTQAIERRSKSQEEKQVSDEEDNAPEA